VSKILSCLFTSFYEKKIQDNHLIFWSLEENLPLMKPKTFASSEKEILLAFITECNRISFISRNAPINFPYSIGLERPFLLKSKIISIVA